MGEPIRASELRQRIGRLTRELAVLSEDLLRPRRMIAASLVERHLGTRRQKRASGAFYLSWAEAGRTHLAYVPQEAVEAVRRQVEAWREYRRTLRRWWEGAETLWGLWRQLGEAQRQRPGRGAG
jgi:hypothetical protein